MNNPFSKTNQPDYRPNRNTFDLSKQKLFTADFGTLYPVYCKEVIPGDSIRIDSTLAVQGMPTLFPLQTRIKANVHYFYVRNRTLWKDWQDFVFKTDTGKNLEHPWLKVNSNNLSMFKTGGIADMLGVPTTVVGSVDGSLIPVNGQSFHFAFVKEAASKFSSVSISQSNAADYLRYRTVDASNINSDASYEIFVCQFDVSNPISFLYSLPTSSTLHSTSGYPLKLAIFHNNEFLANYSFSSSISIVKTSEGQRLRIDFSENQRIQINRFIEEYGSVTFHLYVNPSFGDSSQGYTSWSLASSSTFSQYLWPSIFSSPSSLSLFSDPSVSSVVSSGFDVLDSSDLSRFPFFGDTPDIPLNVLPFRAYEMICNYFYRNELNNPYVLNGVIQYNEFIPTHEGGADSNNYQYHKRNWELDRFTSAVQSPQFGEAPLVGIIARPGASTATLSFRPDASSEDGDSSVYVSPQQDYDITVTLDDDGRINGIANYTDRTPSGSLQNVMDLATAGISINDLRNVNSFQRFLENTLRRGLRYRNQLKSHFGVDVDYPDIDVPQFIGGYSGTLGVGKTTSTSTDSLGDFNGTLGGVVNGKHDITCYCPEHGFIIGIMSLTPIPTYQQNLDKMFMRRDAFDYFQTEFSKIGYVPITAGEIAPLQSENVHTVFGYQRAWYDYISDMDSVHGDFRTTLRDWVLTRLFDGTPKLGRNFTEIDESQLNDVFVQQNMATEYGSNSKFMCQMYFNVQAKRPIPRYGTPSLE